MHYQVEFFRFHQGYATMVTTYKRQGKSVKFRRKISEQFAANMLVSQLVYLFNPEDGGETFNSLQTTRRHIPESQI
jgi:hypothetical protein